MKTGKDWNIKADDTWLSPKNDISHLVANMKITNYRGIKPASIVTVLEGKGTEDSPFTEVMYVVAMEDVQGFIRPITIGKITAIDNTSPNKV